MHSTSLLCLALGYLETVFSTVTVSSINKRAQQESEKIEKLANKILTAGIVKSLIWLMLHSDSDISNLSYEVLKRLLSPSAKSKTRNESHASMLTLTSRAL
jgi:hypothetical protein